MVDDRSQPSSRDPSSAGPRRTAAEQDIEDLRRANLLLASVGRAQQRFITDADPRALFDDLLTTLLEVTESEYGFIGEVLYGDDGNPYLKTHAITNIAWNEETRRFYDESAPRGMEFRNLNTLFGNVMTTKEPVISNTPHADSRSGGLPEGHPALYAFLGVPILRGGRMNGMAGMANRAGGYDETLAQTLAPLLATCGIIIEAMASERKSRASETRYRTLVEDMPDMVCRFRSDGTLTEMNRAFLEIFASEGSTLVGESFFDLLPDRQRERIVERCRGLDLVSPVVTYELTTETRDGGRRIHEWITRAIFDTEVTGTGVVEYQSVGRDVTRRREAEGERRRLESQMFHAQKLESLGVMAGGIAHDFNNLLMGILGNSDLALSQIPENTSGKSFVQEIQTAAIRASELTNQLLAYSGKGRFVVQPVDLNPLVAEMLGLLRTAVGRNVTVQFKPEPHPIVVEADASQLRQVFMNLVTNASDAIGDEPGAVNVHLGVEAVGAEDESASLSEKLVAGDYATLEVSDTGAGMDQATIRQIFDPFYTTKFTGRGLGLAAVLGIVRGHAGAIRVYSEIGVGTTFKILLPLSAKPASATLPVSTPVTQFEELTVLVVDDDTMVLAVTRAFLERAGLRVQTAENGREAIAKFKQRPDEIDLVVLDMTMPEMGGKETFRELRRIRPGVRVILSSGYNEQDATSHFSGKGLAGFIQKPYRSDALIKLVGEVLGAEQGPK